MNEGLKYVAIPLGAIVCAIIAYAYKKNNSKTHILSGIDEEFFTEELQLKDIAVWFKKNIDAYKDNPNISCILLKSDSKILKEYTADSNDFNLYIQAFFDNKESKILKARKVRFEKNNEEIEEMFEGKDLIVFT